MGLWERGARVAATPEASAVLGAGPSQALYAKLSPGPGRPAVEVAAHQRARIYGAMVEIVGERGYGAVTVRELANLAGVSTRTFYQHFEGKEECFLRTYELVVQRAAARIVASQEGERDWLERLRLAFDAFVHEIEGKPRAARLALVEAFVAGPAALDGMRRAECLFGAMVGESFAHALDGIEVPPLLIKGIVSGTSCVARACLLAGRQEGLPELAGELFEWTFSFHNEVAVGLGELDRQLALTSPAVELTSKAGSQGAGAYVREDDRELILTAVAKLAATEGFWQLTVPRIRAAAGVPRRTFDSYFDGVEDCFLAAFELRTKIALEDASAYAALDRGWPEGVQRAIAALCAHLADDPVLAKLAFVEVFASGPSGMLRREALMRAIAELFRNSAPDNAERPTQVATEASVGAVWGILHHYITSGRAQQLPQHVATLSFLALAPAIGAPAAVEAIQREQEEGRLGQVRTHGTRKLDLCL